ncbi:purine-cytosine permease [Mycena maculata]|uniref:Purine-cytosine permease n=1 Tax=Mycena maculata TaxID=230809 RepID=A0AAD7IMB8_9AGAR|nr:purine-cytosine permease [Mycena maculata]
MAASLEKVSEPTGTPGVVQRLSTFLERYGVETHGIAPIPKEQRVDKRSYQLFMLWFAANLNVSSLVYGAAGPVVFKLSLRDTAIILLITDIVSLIIPSYLVYGVVVPSILNVLTMMGYLFFGVIVGGQFLAEVSDHLTPTSGIIVVALISLAVSFCGYKLLHWFASLAWIPTVIGLAVMLGVGGKHLAHTQVSYPPPTVASVLSFAATIAAGNLSWCTMTADYGVYHDADGSSAMIFTYTYLGMFLPTLVMASLGAAFATAAPGVPSWNAGYDHGNNLGGLVSAILAPCGWFGKFLLASMALSMSAANAPTVYSFGMSVMNISVVFARIQRYVFAIVATAICTPLAVVGQTRFYDAFVAGLDIIGYWSASYAGIILTEHVLFRRRDFARYKLDDWDDAKKMPPGVAALLTFCGSFALVVPCMNQRFFVGPVAKAGTGDIGLVVGFFGACVLYGVLRAVEIRLFSGHTS